MSSFVFIDSRVRSYGLVLGNLPPDAQVIVLDPAQDGLAQIAQALQDVTDLDAVHIVSHGSQGALYLGDTVLTGENLDHYTSQLSAIGAALSESGDILLYGCEVANGITGQSFIDGLALYTGADVAASTDATGSSALNGDWVLEANTGTTEATILAPDAYDFLLVATPKPTQLSALNGSNGFRLDGVVASDYSGTSVSNAGDVNGDGFDDLIIGAPKADPNGVSGSGSSYVMFGKSTGFASSSTLSVLNSATTGFRLDGGATSDNSGRAVSAAGDINGDGFGDLIIGAPDADPNGYGGSGASYVVFGGNSSFAPTVGLSSLNGTNGFRLNGDSGNDNSGRSVSAVGDVNGDGFDDLIVGAPYHNEGGEQTGASYVVFGKGSGFASSIDLESLINTGSGFQLNGGLYDRSGWSVSGAGDINGDGFDDLILGAPQFGVDDYYGYAEGASYVVFGKPVFSSNIDLSGLIPTTTGFRITGEVGDDFAGRSVSGAGDINGDGFDDLIIGVNQADPNGLASGASYVIYGKPSFSSNITLSSTLSNFPNASDDIGFKLKGEFAGDNTGFSVSGAGDVNGDGRDDLIIGAIGFDVIDSLSGAVYVVFGQTSFASSVNLSTLISLNQAFRIAGGGASDRAGWSVSAAGDVNGDGFSDLVVGAADADPNGLSLSGSSYVVFGGNFTDAVTFSGTVGNDPISAINTNSAESFVSGQGNDTITGLGGADVFHAGSGNDRIVVPDINFAIVDGGSGTDTLALTANVGLDLTSLNNNRISGIEVIDFTTGNHALTLAVRDLFDLSDSSNTLRIDGAGGDSVTLTGAVSAARISSDGYVRYAQPQGNAMLMVATGILVNFPSGTDNLSETLTGGAAADTIYGGGGNDTLTGGGGADVFELAADGGTDLITDFSDGDAIRVTGLSPTLPFATGNGGTVTANQVQVSSNAVVTTLFFGLNGTDGFDLSVQLTGTFTANQFRVSGGDIGFNHAPVLAVAIPNQNAIEDGTFNYVVPANTFSDSDADTLAWSATLSTGAVLPTWLTFTAGTRTFSGTPLNGDVGSVDVKVTAKDGSNASTSDIFRITVANLNDAPTVANPIPNQIAQINNSFGFTFAVDVFADVDVGDSLTYIATKSDGNPLPLWLSFNATTRTFNGMPAAGDIGNLNVKVTATDGTNASVIDTFIISVVTDDEVKNGDAGDNSLFGGTGNDTLNGLGGSDTLDGGSGIDSLVGGLGNDTYIVDHSSDQVVEFNGGAEGSDVVQASENYTLPGSVEFLLLMGDGDIDGTGNNLPNEITGTSGNNQLDGGIGIDILNGGAGDDIYVVDEASDQVNEELSAGTDTVHASNSVPGTTFVLSPNVEHIDLTGAVNLNAIGNALRNALTGNSGNNNLAGGDGNDTLIGNAGNDTLDGGLGSDTMEGGLGNDVYHVDSVDNPDVVTENAGAGTGIDIVHSSVSWILGANVERLTLAGNTVINGTGNTLANYVIGNSASNILDGGGGISNDTLEGGDGNDTLISAGGNDSLDGGAGNDSLSSGAGNDTLRGGSDTDTMVGGSGNDVYHIDTASDVVIEGADDSDGTADQVVIAVDFTANPQVFQLYAGIERVSVFDINAFVLVTGNDLDNLFEGGNGDDSLDGAQGDDTLDGAGGDDTLNGGTGVDSMKGGAGNDLYYVDNQLDVVEETDVAPGALIAAVALVDGFIDAVDAIISYSLQNVALVENLTLSGTATTGTGNELDNKITGNELANTLNGLDGDDTLIGGDGDDTLNGGAGIDTVSYAGAGSAVIVTPTSQNLVGAGNDVLSGIENVIGSAYDDVITGGTIANLLKGELGHDNINGGLGNDTLNGGDGDDTLTGSTGDDSLAGGVGLDWAYYNGAGSAVTVNLATVIAQNTQGAGTDTLNTIEHVLGSNYHDTLTGNSAANQLDGGAGNDTLDGGSGNDTMKGGGGNDQYTVAQSGDVVIENAGGGTDTVLSGVTHTLAANVEHLTLTGVGNSSANGNSLANNLTGNSGNNTLNGGTGNDTMIGGLGNDTYVVNAAGDVVTEAAAAGTDLVQASTSHTLGANVENLTLTGAGNSSGNGNGLDNILTGNSKNNMLNGGTGSDTMVGGAGNDTYSVNAAGDVVTEAADAGTDTVNTAINYTLTVNVENLTQTGSANTSGTGNTLNNKLTGNSGNNTLSGNDGADTLTGGSGADTLTGGTGIDLFDYNALTDAADTITDFTAGAGGDKLDIDTLLTVLGYGGADPLAAGYVQLLQAGAHTQVNIDSNGGGDNFATTLVTLQNVTAGNVTLADNFMV